MTLQKIDSLNIQDIEVAKKAMKQANSILSKIEDRCNYIMQSVFAAFEEEHAYWYFFGAKEGEVGDFLSHYTKDSVSVIVDCEGDLIILLKDNSEWNLNDSFPSYWLFEDFEKELISGKKKYEDKKIKEALKKKEAETQKKEKKKQLLESAKNKLTKEELEALGIK